MNRREFTASLAALAAAPALPMAAPAAAAPAALPPGAYLWAELIARAQNACSPAMIARHLGISNSAAEGLFSQMLRDGVINAPGITGVAQAANPLRATGAENSVIRTAGDKITTWVEDRTQPLVKAEEASLGCDVETAPEDHADASPCEPPEESPERG